MPYRGDVRYDEVKYPPGTPWSSIVEFEVWDGESWLSQQQVRDRIYRIETSSGSS